MTTSTSSAAATGLPEFTLPTPRLAEKISADISDLGYALQVLTDEVTSITAHEPAFDEICRASAMARIVQNGIERISGMMDQLLAERQS